MKKQVLFLSLVGILMLHFFGAERVFAKKTAMPVMASTLGDFVWEDFNYNGVQDPGEYGINGVQIDLLADTDNDGQLNNVVATTTSNGSGAYQFTGLAAGSYRVRFVVPLGKKIVLSDKGGNDATDSDADPATGLTAVIVLDGSAANTAVDAGLYGPCTFGNYIWQDANGNGIQDPTEPGISGVSVLLTGTTGVGSPVNITTVSGNTGLYLFSDVSPGTYKLTFTAPVGMLTTKPDAGVNDATDSDVNPLTGQVPLEVLTSGENNLSYDAGFYIPCTAGNYVWQDVNRNGTQDAGEPGISGVSVLLTGTTGDGSPTNLTTVSNNAGLYLFSDLKPGTYKLSVTAPAGMTFTIPDRGTDATDSDVNPLTGKTPNIVLASGGNNLTLDAGFYAYNTASFIYGTIKNDQNSNCIAEIGEEGLNGWLVSASGSSGTYYALSDPDGQYRVFAPPGLYAINSEIPPSFNGAVVCALPQNLSLVDSVLLNIPVKNVKDCPNLVVDLSTIRLRRCFDSYYEVQYCNKGTDPATNAYITLKLDSLLSFQTASIPYSMINNQQYRFDIGTVVPNECKTFSVKVKVSCDALPGQSHCSEAHIYPDSSCHFASTQWSGAKIETYARCLGNTLRFVIKNTGTGPMTSNLEYVIIEDGVMGMPTISEPLTAGDSMLINLPGNGSTWRIEAKQEPTYQGASLPVLSVEGCTNNATFSTGFVQQYEQNEALPAIDIDCSMNTGSFDPNDKQAVPIGYGSAHYIKPWTALEYTIRFQNTGTDTAFAVVIRDTLSPLFDLKTLRFGASKHPYTADLSGSGVIAFRFPGIQLPQKSINEAASEGYVRYSIAPKENTPPESIISNRAGIYFDYNAPVITNTTTHRIGINFVSVSVQQPEKIRYRTVVQPNPFTQSTTILLKNAPIAGNYQLRIFTAAGRLVHEQQSQTALFLFNANHLSEGAYFFQILGDTAVLGIGKMIVAKE